MLHSRSRHYIFAQLIIIWLTANFLPHIVIYLLTGKLYFALEPVTGFIVELALMALNLTLPIVAITLLPPKRAKPLGSSLAWNWKGWSNVGWGIIGLLAILATFEIVNRFVGTPPFAYGGGLGRPLTFPQDSPLLLLLLTLWLVTTLGEEIMFRGYLQTSLSEIYGALSGLMGAALLFALRHLPADLFWGSGASWQQWTSRILQLGLSALILGWLRQRTNSTITTWITHLCLWIAVIVINAVADT